MTHQRSHFDESRATIMTVEDATLIEDAYNDNSPGCWDRLLDVLESLESAQYLYEKAVTKGYCSFGLVRLATMTEPRRSTEVRYYNTKDYPARGAYWHDVVFVR